MRGVSRRIINIGAVAAVVATLITQPALPATRTQTGGGFGSLIRRIIRVLDTIQIGLPPG
jgi:hypothetical protein